MSLRTLAAVFRALSHETRLLMLGLLLHEPELCVCDFVEVLGVTQSKASRHLRYLVNVGLLEDRREAIWVHFRITETPAPLQATVLAGLRQMLPDHALREALQVLKAWRKCKAKNSLAGKSPIMRKRAPGSRR